MRTVKLYGKLARKFGKLWRLDVQTPAEAIRAIEANRPGFLRCIMDMANSGIEFRCMLDGRDMEADELAGPFGREAFKLIPVPAGSDSGGIIKTIVGAILIGAAIFFSGGSLSAALPGFMSFMSWGSVAMFGVAMMAGGISQMLTSTPDLAVGDKGDNRASYGFNGAVNTVMQGGPVPVGYGRLIVGSYVISAGIRADDIPVGAAYA